jgi:hypothetical protein
VVVSIALVPSVRVHPSKKRITDPLFSRHARESEHPGATAAAPAALGPRFRACEEIENRWINAVRPSRQPLRGFLRMTEIINAIKGLRHGEERLKGASRTTHSIGAVPNAEVIDLFTRFFAGATWKGIRVMSVVVVLLGGEDAGAAGRALGILGDAD